MSTRRSSRSAAKAQPAATQNKIDLKAKDDENAKVRKTKSQSKDKAEDPQPTKKVKKQRVKDDTKKDSDSDKVDKKKDAPKQHVKPQKQPVKKAKDEEKQIKKVTMVGSAPVDPHFPNAGKFRVVEKDGKIYAATLNQSNISANNNKFYILQIIETDPNKYVFFCRWGRVGVQGQSSQMQTTDIQTAISEYNSKLNSKLRGGYTLVEMNYDNDDKDEKEQEKQEKEQEPEVESDLPKETQDLIRLIFDMKMMNNQMKQIGYDAKKMPLGKLSKTSIEKGYEALKNLMDEAKGKNRRHVFEQYSSEFFSNIPHDFGFIKMQNFILDTEQKIKAKLEMLQSLEDIQVYTKILNEGKISSDMNQVDSNYLKLKTEVKPIDKKSELFKSLQKYVKNSHAATHNNYRLQVQEIYSLDKQQENKRFKTDIHNKQLLWHGSRLTNFVGILSQGLRIAPPEAPVTGYMFGKGVYFADMVSKSANYCCTSRNNNTGLMLLCEVALGNCWEKFAADYYASNLPPGMHSTKGVGRTAPKGGELIEGVFAPNSQCQPTNVAYTSLLYNEYIVYDVSQIRSKYLFKMKFHYN